MAVPDALQKPGPELLHSELKVIVPLPALVGVKVADCPLPLAANVPGPLAVHQFVVIVGSIELISDWGGQFA